MGAAGRVIPGVTMPPPTLCGELLTRPLETRQTAPNSSNVGQ